MKIVFAGTPAFAVPVLQALVDSEYQVVAVYTQPDRPKGRGQKAESSPIKQLASQHGIPVETPLTLKDFAAQQQLVAYQPDVMVVVAYGLLLPDAVLAIPRLGCINVHASLLPRWRGASPIQQAILAGDAESGVTIMRMVTALDAGDMLASAAIPLAPDETSQSLHDRLAPLGAQLLLPVLAALQQGTAQAIPQDEQHVTYAKKIQKTAAEIDWQQPADFIERQVRAYYGWPVAFTHHAGKLLRIWRAEASAETHTLPPGRCVIEGKTLRVACGSGWLNLQAVQLPGGKMISVSEFLNAQRRGLEDVNYFGS